jgi:segregation and condensation protein B
MTDQLPLDVPSDNQRHPNLRLLEAILFATAEPLTTNAIRERMPQDADVGGLLMALQADYARRGVVLVDLDGSWAFRTAPDLADSLQVERQVQRKMSRAAMETLSIVAYHQPVTRAEIENIRGVATNKGTLDVLLEAGWVKPGRRREAPGRPLTWVTTTAFLDQFGLEALTDLPGLDEMKVSGLLDRRPAIDAIPGTRDLFGEEEIASSDEQEYEEEKEFEPESTGESATNSVSEEEKDTASWG